ncbi:MAG: TolC family protein [Cloacibacillus sp.]
MMIKKLAASLAALALFLSAGAGHAAPLTIDECLAMAMEKNPSLTAAREKVNSQRATIGQAASTGRPQLSAGSSYTRGGTGASADNNSGSYSTGVKAEQSITDWGRRDAKVRGAQLSTEAASHDYYSTRETVIENVYAAYYGLNRSVRENAVAKSRYDNFAKRLKWAKAYYEVGTKPKIEVTKAEADLAASKLAIVKSQAAAEQYKAQLADAMGVPALAIAEVTDIIDYEDWNIGFEAAMARAMKERPELLAKQKRVEYAGTNLTVQMKGLSPSLSASAGYDVYGSSPVENNEWSTKLSLTVPLSDGGLTKSKTEQARADLRTAQAELQSLTNTVTLEIRQALAALAEAKEALASSLEAERSAKATLDLAEGRYAAGVGSNLEISDAIDSYALARSNTVLALYSCKTARLGVEKAMGGLKYGE